MSLRSTAKRWTYLVHRWLGIGGCLLMLLWFVSGMVMLLLGRVPKTSDYTEWHGWRFEVVDMDGKRIDKVLASPLPPLEIAPQPPET